MVRGSAVGGRVEKEVQSRQRSGKRVASFTTRISSDGSTRR